MRQNVFATYSADLKLKNYVFIHRLLKNTYLNQQDPGTIND